MPSVYPGGLDTLANPTSSDTLDDPSHADQHADVNDAIEAIEGELGTDPAGSEATVAARIAAIESNTAPLNPWVGNPDPRLMTSSTSTTANRVHLTSFTLLAPVTVTGAKCQIVTSSGNFCLGLYDSAGNRLGTTGSVAVPSTGVATISLTASVDLVPGERYWTAIVFDNATASTFYAGISTHALLGDMGLNTFVDSTFPLAASLTIGTAAFNRSYGVFFYVSDQLVACDGDSLTAGGQAGAVAYPTHLAALLSTVPLQGASVSNFGAAAATIATLAADADTQIDPLYDAMREPVVVFWAGTNDIGAGTDAATIQAAIQSYCEDRQAAGFSVVVGTIIPRKDAGFTAGMETIRNTVNGWIITNWATFADALADFTAHPAFDAQADADDTTYYNADKLHLNTTGYALIASIVKTAIDSI